MKRLFSFMLILGLCGSVFANDINVRTSVQNVINTADKSATFEVAGTGNATSDSILVRGSKELCFVYDVSSSGTVDIDLYASFSTDGVNANAVGSTKIADIVATGKGVANVSTVYPLPYAHIVADGQGSNDASTETTIKVGQR
jgi:hypothetical protein